MRALSFGKHINIGIGMAISDRYLAFDGSGFINTFPLRELKGIRTGIRGSINAKETKLPFPEGRQIRCSKLGQILASLL